MRKIKIRAWNTSTNKFENEYYIKCSNNHENMVSIKFDMEKFTYRKLQGEEVVFLLNTGLRDRKGVEGFHKDLVMDFRGGIYSIEWDEAYAAFILKGKDKDNYLPIYFLRYGEIIGNTFEN